MRGCPSSQMSTLRRHRRRTGANNYGVILPHNLKLSYIAPGIRFWRSLGLQNHLDAPVLSIPELLVEIRAVL